MTASEPCRAILLTPQGRGAVATILVEGRDATGMVDSLFRSAAGKPVEQFPVDRIIYGRWQEEDQGKAEQLIVCRRSEQRVEVHCHGGRAAPVAIVQSLVRAGCRETSWQDWLRDGEADPIVAEAHVALAGARTERAAAILLEQYHGALSTAVRRIITLLEAGDAERALGQLRDIRQFAAIGRHLVEPWRVVLAGQPNAGKSSLINALVGYRRAIVYETPGTTRDALTATTALDGWPVELTDTAGLRRGGDPIEAAGVIRARDALATADAVVLVFDASRSWTEEDQALIAAVPDAVVVHNKRDLITSADTGRPPGLYTSATRGEAVDRLIGVLTAALVPAPPPPGAAVPFTTRQDESLQRAGEAALTGHVQEAISHLRQLAPKSAV